MTDERDEVAQLLASRSNEQRDPFPHEYVVADLILSSDWLAKREGRAGPVACAPIASGIGDSHWFECACGALGPGNGGVWSTVLGARSEYLQHVVARVVAAQGWPGSVDVDYREDDA